MTAAQALAMLRRFARREKLTIPEAVCLVGLSRELPRKWARTPRSRLHAGTERMLRDAAMARRRGAQ